MTLHHPTLSALYCKTTLQSSTTPSHTHTHTRYLFVPSTDHASHRQAHASVTQHHVRQQLGGSSHRDPVVVPQPVQPVGNNRQSNQLANQSAMQELRVGL